MRFRKDSPDIPYIYGDWQFDPKSRIWTGPRDPANAERSLRGLYDFDKVARANRASRKGR